MEQENRMKYLKTYELFDNEDLKSQFEIPHLQGKFDIEEIEKWKPMKNDLDPELTQIINEVPWLIEFKYRRSGSVLSLGFENTIKYDEDNQVFYYFLIEIVKFQDTYGLHVYAKCHGNGQQIYNESLIKKAMPYNEMLSQLKRPVFNMAVDFSNFIEKMFKESNLSFKDKEQIIFNPNLN